MTFLGIDFAKLESICFNFKLLNVYLVDKRKVVVYGGKSSLLKEANKMIEKKEKRLKA